MSTTLRHVLLVVVLCMSTLGIGLYAGVKRLWPLPQLKRLLAERANPAIKMDQFGRLLSYPGKTEIPCPTQDEKTAVLLLIGQSNAANYQGQRHQSADDRVLNFSAGRCYRAASPLLGADGQMGETWTLLGNKLIQSGLYRTVILIPAAVGGSAIHRWAAGDDLNEMMKEVIRAALERYTITGVLWNQGAADFILGTSEAQYRADLKSLIDSIRTEGVRAPFFITRSSQDSENWSEDNPVARAQASLADSEHGIFDGPNADHDVSWFDRYDGSHYGASGQEKYSDAWIPILRAHPLQVN
ncbi:sialate O-acetylesterase [Methylocella sp.]|uniref:sialate O-acetylesterase n=1 Tax=Methylocella sp. TaxID=1978226 RepID=UPI003C715196